MGKARLHIELTADLKLLLPPDDHVKRLALGRDDTFELEGVTYTVIAIDANKARVILRDELTQKELVVTRMDPAVSVPPSDAAEL
jgi:hypothetical protein